MLTRARNEVIATSLTLIGQGETVTLDVTYYNRKQSEVEAMLTNGEDGGIPATILFMVQSWDSEYPLTVEGIKELEDDRPGIIMGIIQGFHDARRMEKEKN